jgi:hypothetical protein
MKENDEPEEEKGPVKVAIPDINDESMRSFFYTREITELSTQKVDVSIDDFNELFILANDMYVFNNSEGILGYRNRTLSHQSPSYKATRGNPGI